MKFKIFLVVALIVLPVFSQAETVVRTGDAVQVAEDQIVESDFYAAGESVLMSGTIAGDMYAVGGSVTINGIVTEDLTLFSGTAHVHASVTDDVRVLGGEVILAESVGGDVFVIGGSLQILSTASVGGDVYFFGGEADISGDVAGSVVGTAERVRIDSVVNGEVDVTTQQLTLGERANIIGNVQYKSQGEIQRSQAAVVQGNVNRTQPELLPTMSPKDVLLPLLIALFSTLCAFLLFRARLHTLVQSTVGHVGRNGLIGLAVVLLSLPLTILLMLTVLGFWLGLVVLLGTLLLYVVAFVVMHIYAGALLARVFGQGYRVDLVWIIIGTIAVQALVYVPVLGALAILALFTIALGSLVMSGFKSLS